MDKFIEKKKEEIIEELGSQYEKNLVEDASFWSNDYVNKLAYELVLKEEMEQAIKEVTERYGNEIERLQAIIELNDDIIKQKIEEVKKAREDILNEYQEKMMIKLLDAREDEREKIGEEFKKWSNDIDDHDSSEDIEDAIERITGVKC